jgi:murein DD-endopeptidase MepM/ murein hydrolase activator NlpD
MVQFKLGTFFVPVAKMTWTMKGFKIIGWVFLTIVGVGLIYPQNFSMPVDGATNKSYHQKSFWFYPWGKSGTHKGVDIFARKGTPVRSSTTGLVLYTGQLKLGGNVVVVLGPKWRLHYYAHLHEIKTSNLSLIGNGEEVGSVGTSGNAAGKPAHLHYSIATLIPYVWRIDKDPQGWKKMFYLNPIDYLEKL